MITCRDVYNLQLDGVELLTGEAGLERMVSWTYMVQTRPYEDHMNPGNFALIVIDNVRHTLESAFQSMIELNNLGISALAISVENDETAIPDYFIEEAIKLELPLFYVRWEGASFVDIDQSIGKLILETQVRNKREGDYLYNLLWGYEVNDKYVEKISGQFGLDFSKTYRVGIIVIDRKYGVNLEQDEHTYEYYIDCLNREIIHLEKHVMYMQFLNMFVLLFEEMPDKDVEKELERLLQELDNRTQFKGIIRGTCILGGVYSNPKDFGKSYQEAKALISKKDILPNPTNKKVISSSSLGIYKYMFNSGNKDEILDYCNKRLKKLEEYDHANGSFLVDTIVSYYMNGFSVVKTADALFIHRNSLQYRLRKIEEILEATLDDYMEYLDLVNCILIKKLVFDMI